MEGYGCRRSHPLAPANDGLLLSDEALLPMALDLMVLWAAITERTSAPATG